MRIYVAGGTGFVGRQLLPRLTEAGHEPWLLVRPSARPRAALPAGVHPVKGNPLAAGPWWDALADCDAAINLVGEPIHGYWSPEKKSRIRSSRLVSTGLLVDHLPADRPFTLISASAVGYYGDGGERILDEASPAGPDFLARVARDWEQAAMRAAERGARVVVTRFGAVLGRDGALVEMIKSLRGPRNGVLGNGRHWVSWIHQDDLAAAMLFLLDNEQARGPFNLSSPHPVRQAELARTLGRLTGHSRGLPTPAKAVRLAVGGFADALLASQRMRPRALLEAGFAFRFPQLEAALRDILAGWRI